MSTHLLRAVMVTPSALGGHARYTWELMSAMRNAAPPSEVRLTLLTSSDLDAEFRTSSYEIADVLPPLRDRRSFATRFEWAASRMLHYARREEMVLRWLREHDQVDVVHYQEPPFAAALHYRRVMARGMRAVATVHNLKPHRYHVPLARGLSDSAAWLAWKQCAALFVHSEGLGRQLTAKLGASAPPVVTIPHGVWTGHEAMAKPRPDGYLLMFGVMRRNKGVHGMLDALRTLPGTRLVLAGAFTDRGLAAEVRERIAAEGLNVEVHDRVIPEAELPKMFAGASLVVLPYTDFSAQSGVLHLAIKYGVPVVVNDVGALGEEVRQHGLGAVTPRVDPVELGRTIRQALDPVAHSAAHERCRELASTLSWTAAANLTLGCYQRVCLGDARS